MSKNRDRPIRKQKPLKGNIPPASFKDETSGISFSFKYFVNDNDKFRVEDSKAQEYFPVLLSRLKDLSSWRMSELMSCRSDAVRFHPIHFSETTEPDGFPIKNMELWEDSSFQFSVSANEYGRVHGFMIANVFYVVWFDPYHRLYAQQ